jgi:hypothetical protein
LLDSPAVAKASARNGGVRSLESDGEYDEGWTGSLPEEDEIVGLLGGDKVRFHLMTI